jgi:hypothetical protein
VVGERADAEARELLAAEHDADHLRGQRARLQDAGTAGCARRSVDHRRIRVAEPPEPAVGLPQGQGQSDIPGERAAAQEDVPAQSGGRPFFDGTEDALQFFFSFYYRLRLDIDGVTCEDLRAGCPGMAPDGSDDYSYPDLATSSDAGTG